MAIHPLIPIAGLGAAAYFLFFRKSDDPAQGIVAPDAPQAKPNVAPALGTALTSAILSPKPDAGEAPVPHEVARPSTDTPLSRPSQEDFDRGFLGDTSVADLLTPGTNVLADLFAPTTEVHQDGGLSPTFQELPPGGGGGGGGSNSSFDFAPFDFNGGDVDLSDTPDLSPAGIFDSIFSGSRHGMNLLSPIGRLINRGRGSKRR